MLFSPISAFFPQLLRGEKLVHITELVLMKKPGKHHVVRFNVLYGTVASGYVRDSAWPVL